jgi:hypothetical protein
MTLSPVQRLAGRAFAVLNLMDKQEKWALLEALLANPQGRGELKKAVVRAMKKRKSVNCGAVVANVVNALGVGNGALTAKLLVEAAGETNIMLVNQG